MPVRLRLLAGEKPPIDKHLFDRPRRPGQVRKPHHRRVAPPDPHPWNAVRIDANPPQPPLDGAPGPLRRRPFRLLQQPSQPTDLLPRERQHHPRPLADLLVGRGMPLPHLRIPLRVRFLTSRLARQPRGRAQDPSRQHDPLSKPQRRPRHPARHIRFRPCPHPAFPRLAISWAIPIPLARSDKGTRITSTRATSV